MNENAVASPWQRFPPLAILAASIGALATAFIADHVFGLQPCALCLYQRWVYVAAGALGMAGLFLPLGARRAAVAVAGMVFLGGAGLAFYHVGVEQHWWAQTAACAGTVDLRGLTVEQLRNALQTPPPKPCDEVDWTLFGISLAGYNVLASLVLAVLCLTGTRALGPKP
jgi:disulfide bond formation protein DsbB